MNAPDATLSPPLLHEVVLAALDTGPPAYEDAPEAHWLAARQARCDPSPRAALDAWLESPPGCDRLLHGLATSLGLQAAELVALALACGVETDPMLGRVLTWLQAPVGGSRPTLGLVLAVAQALGFDATPNVLLEGKARDVGLLGLDSDLETNRRPLPEQALHVPLPLALTLHEGRARWPGIELAGPGSAATAASLRQAAERQARALCSGALAVRAGHPGVARTAAALLAAALGRQAAFFEQDVPRGAGLWATLHGAIPVLCLEQSPGEARKLASIPGYHGPLLIATGPEGSFSLGGDTVGSWRVPLPLADERATLWSEHVDDPELARHLGICHRQDAARIQLLGRTARHEADLEGATGVAPHHVRRAARSGLAADLGTLAELLPEHIDDDALIIPPPLRATLDALTRRCELREALPSSLGPAARTRYRPGVRALFVGPSGTGKTLAAGWLATRLGLPLYRVDIAAVTSKYIGETEKNLAQLFARAEHAEVVLLFDEADSLFGRRTEIKESNDRFANTQTNYLLQRIESFEGIALLTSNSRSRFDSAFTRRLDAILEFPHPSPEERRALWVSHLGDLHTLTPAELNRLAASCDLAGGHIRNVVLGAAARALHQGRRIAYPDLTEGIDSEFRKLGKQPPAGLAGTHGRL